MKNRKQLPTFKALNRKIDIDALLKQCENDGLFDYNKYNDIQKSADSGYKNFLVGNSACKNGFFIREDEQELEGELYKQLYLTNYKGNNVFQVNESPSTVKSRLRRIDPSNKNYMPVLDEYNYGEINDLCNGILKNILDSFQSPLTRVRLAVLMPGMTIKKHRDYDPSYICRYHIPIITNNMVEFGMEVNGKDEIFHMKNDGSVYFFNSGLPHWVTNNGTEPRLHLIVDTNGQLDLST
jgi:hypothetical protein